MTAHDIRAVLFDFGGVIAEEGFRQGLYAIARDNGLDQEVFFALARDLILETGFLTGRVAESAYWEALRRATGIRGSDAELKKELLERFVIRDWMMALVDRIKDMGIKAVILSDQTSWLDELNARSRFFDRFAVVFNSFYLGKSKHDASIFSDVTRGLFLFPQQALFIDDQPGNVERARSCGLHAICYQDRAQFLAEIATYLPALG